MTAISFRTDMDVISWLVFSTDSTFTGPGKYSGNQFGCRCGGIFVETLFTVYTTFFLR
jgi:hypothetical protein